MARYETAPGFHSPRARNWRDARHLVIEGEARVIGHKPGEARAPAHRNPSPTAPVWGAALRAADAAALSVRRSRIALPAGLALFGLAALLLAPGEGSEPIGHQAQIARAGIQR